ncbi:hypothetical protein C8Q76DRAFT_392515 [Earliella scabrosa]|nr:hypothetical protein C8Q76DRAFT_392515 [Earliella scabrosa]
MPRTNRHERQRFDGACRCVVSRKLQAIEYICRHVPHTSTALAHGTHRTPHGCTPHRDNPACRHQIHSTQRPVVGTVFVGSTNLGRASRSIRGLTFRGFRTPHLKVCLPGFPQAHADPAQRFHHSVAHASRAREGREAPSTTPSPPAHSAARCPYDRGAHRGPVRTRGLPGAPRVQSCLAPPRAVAVAVTRRTRSQYSSRLERADQEEGRRSKTSGVRGRNENLVILSQQALSLWIPPSPSNINVIPRLSPDRQPSSAPAPRAGLRLGFVHFRNPSTTYVAPPSSRPAAEEARRSGPRGRDDAGPCVLAFPRRASRVPRAGAGFANSPHA